jgi:hypothetical protein
MLMVLVRTRCGLGAYSTSLFLGTRSNHLATLQGGGTLMLPTGRSLHNITTGGKNHTKNNIPELIWNCCIVVSAYPSLLIWILWFYSRYMNLSDTEFSTIPLFPIVMESIFHVGSNLFQLYLLFFGHFLWVISCFPVVLLFGILIVVSHKVLFHINTH